MNKWADMWESLVAGGMSEADATARVQAAQQEEASRQQPMERMPDGPYAQSRGVPMQDANLPAPRRELSGIGNLLMGANQIVRGATGGLSDRAIAGVASLGPGVSYDDARRELDRRNAEFADANPVTNAALNIAGGIVPGSPMAKLVGKASGLVGAAAPGASALSTAGRNIARGMVGGGAGGAVAGAGYQSGDVSLTDQALKGLTTGLGGAALGGAVSAVAPILSRAGSVAADVSGLRTLGRGTPAGTVPRAPGEGTALQRAYDKAEGFLFPASASRVADRKIAGALTDLGEKSLDDVAADLRFQNLATGNRAMIADQGDDLVMRLARGAKTKSQEASQTLGKALKGRDRQLLADVNRDISETVGAPVNTVKAGKALKAQGQNASTPLYDATRDRMVTLSPDSRGVLLDRDPRGIFAAAHRIARDLAQEEGKTIPKLFAKMDDGTRALARDAMSVQEIDYLKRGIQELANTGTRSGKTISKMRARNMLKNLESLVGDADTQVPDFARARAEFQAPMAQRDAMTTALKGGKQFGREGSVPSFKSGSPDELGEFVEGLQTAGERDFYDIGKGASMYRDAARNPRKFVRDLNNADTQAKISRTTQARDAGRDADLFTRGEVRNEQVRRMNDIMSQSKTAENITDAASSDLVGNLGQFVYAPMRAAGRLAAGQSLAGLQKSTAGEIGKRMALQGPLADDYVRYLMRLQGSDAANAFARGNAGRTALATLLGLTNADY